LTEVISVGYRIEYGPVKKLRGVEKRISSVSSLIGLLLLLMILCFSQYGSTVLKEVLIPGDPEITVAAFSDMTDQLCNGTELQEAILCFCVDILEGAGIDLRR
jgi:hypothetical protein